MERGGQNYWYHTDGLGSITAITDEAGAVVKTYLYDSFGDIVSETGSLANPYTYTGREFDEESGLYYYRARYYDARVGRFLQEDPLGVTNEINLYVYSVNNPINYIDPYGLYEVGFKGIGNFAAEKIISDEVKKYAPEMPKNTRDKAARALRKEMTADEYKRLKNKKIPKAEKIKIIQDIIGRAKERTENQEFKKELEPYLDEIFKKGESVGKNSKK